MQNHAAVIERLINEHEQSLTKVQELDAAVGQLASLKQDWIPGRPLNLAQDLDRLEKTLKEISEELEGHLRFEENEFLPLLTNYAADIIRSGLMFEHRQILDSIAVLRKSARGLVGKYLSRDELLVREYAIKESINNILRSVQEHARIQEVIFNLAKEALSLEL
jgi:iron-sulfur cluster repair protein YtfE (RIC family)